MVRKCCFTDPIFYAYCAGISSETMKEFFRKEEKCSYDKDTIDFLNMTRHLKDLGIEVDFEKENIWMLDTKGELMITIMSSLAQEESRSISENTT